MKKAILALLTAGLLLALTACGNQAVSSSEAAPSTAESAQAQTPSASTETAPDAEPASSAGSELAAEQEEPLPAAADTEPEAETPPTAAEAVPERTPSPAGPEQTAERGKTLVAYFSATGSTRAAAEAIAELTGAELYEIVPAEAYTADDLDYNVSDSRANREMNDASARPAIGSDSIDISGCDTVFLGYPIWWGQAPRIISTFLESYDLSGKTIIPFCTSGSSDISGSLSGLQALAPDSVWLEGWRFSGSADRAAVEDWVNSLQLTK